MERSLTFTIDIDNGVPQSADASLLGILQPPSPSEQRHFHEQEGPEFLDGASAVVAADDLTISEEIIAQSQSYINRVIPINLPSWATGDDFHDLISRFRQAFGGAADAEAAGEVFVPASDAALAGLEKETFHAVTAEGRGSSECVVTGCAICLEDFEDGEEVTVMPCSGEHKFHHDCITMWLGKRNTCPLCRHALPTDVMDEDDWM